ncbi:MAG: hypothetical protein CSA09_03145 [Candidatus Contendobacter odensis]|uniref:CheW-like domain-containing protein n=1 Tax=Candidatus Contendibacter odensensis TaxID=1400860 RepID=A0A2G6PF06_9GAMM|nr:MAG: hypothetical protein CSA09_03145 [Candidatus Contendobacter odensis]
MRRVAPPLLTDFIMDTVSLRCLLITLHGGQVILPSSLVIEVLPFATPLRIEAAPPWVVGAMLWQNLTTPLVSLGRLVFGVPPDDDTNSRIVIVNALGVDPKLPHFGILGTAAPRPFSMQREDICLDPAAPEEDSDHLGVLGWARYNEHPVIIPDLEAIESVLQPLVRRN